MILPQSGTARMISAQICLPVGRFFHTLDDLKSKTRVFRLSIESIVVQGRFRESIPDDLILLAIFAGEREDSSKKSRNRFRLATSPKPKWAKNEPFNQKLAEKDHKNPNFVSYSAVFHIINWQNDLQSHFLRRPYSFCSK
jgi:hypothetical protein